MYYLSNFYVTFLSKKVTKNSDCRNLLGLSTPLNLAKGVLMSEANKQPTIKIGMLLLAFGSPSSILYLTLKVGAAEGL
jgi:hypothetical protein